MAKQLFNAKDSVIPVYFPGVLFRLLESEGFTHDRLLEGTRLDAASFTDDKLRISFEEHSQFIKNAMTITQDAHLGWRFGQHINVTALGMVGYAMMSSSTFESAIDILTQFFKIRAPLYDLRFLKQSNRPGYAALEIDESLDFGANRYFLLVSAVSGVDCVSSYFLNKKQVLRYVELACSKPLDWDSVKDKIEFEVSFDAPTTRVYFDEGLLKVPIPTADPQTEETTKQICQQLLATVEQQTGIVNEVKQYVLGKMGQFPSLKEAADHFCMSSRTFRRELQKSGTTYQQVLDNVREKIAIEMLCKTKKTVNEIAFELGYSDVSNFGRAFKNWTGKVPSEFRR